MPNPSEGNSSQFVFLFLAVHSLLALAMHRFPMLATTHALSTIAGSLYISATARQLAPIIYAAAYIGGSEVLWRMTKASVFWEIGKYAIAAMLLVYLSRHRARTWPWLPTIYFLLLIPSTFLTLTQLVDLDRFRNIVSFNLSGPFALFVCACALYQCRLSVSCFSKIALMTLGPLTGVAVICSYSTARLGKEYDFGTESNFDVTGGFGPNQVSSALGLAILLSFLWIHLNPTNRTVRAIAIILVLGFSAVAALTLSRTGIWMGLGTILAATAFIVRDKRRFLSGVISIVLIAGVGYSVLFPLLDKFTNGQLGARFREEGFSRREDIARADLALAAYYPVFGVGLGMAPTVRAQVLGVRGAAHTEFTRLLAEHGSMGLLALCALLLSAVQAFLANRRPLGQAWAASLLAYCAFFMLASGMRLAAPALAFGLAMLRPLPSMARRPNCDSHLPPLLPARVNGV